MGEAILHHAAPERVKGSFQKKNDETYGKFHILGGERGGQQGVIFHML